MAPRSSVPFTHHATGARNSGGTGPGHDAVAILALDRRVPCAEAVGRGADARHDDAVAHERVERAEERRVIDFRHVSH